MNSMLSITTKIAIIYNGWKNYIFPDDNVRKIAEERANICASCEHMKQMNAKVGIRLFMIWKCSICGCPIGPKTYSIYNKNGQKNKCSDNSPRWE